MIPPYYDAPNVVEGIASMRGGDQQTGWRFSYVSPEERVPPDHPLHGIRRMTDTIFERLRRPSSGCIRDPRRPLPPNIVVDEFTLLIGMGGGGQRA